MFPGARADRDHADYVVVGAPLDVSTSFRPGTRFGPERIRQFSRQFEEYDPDTGLQFTDLGVHDAGNVRAWNDAAEYLDHLEVELGSVVRDGAVPLLVGGEHTVSVAGVRAVDPDVVVCLDAHLDLREELDGDELSHATVTRHALDVADRAVILGARAGSGAEYDRADGDDVRLVPPEEVPDWSPDPGNSVYLSVDIDAADPGVAPATGTPEPFGLAPREMERVVRAVAPHADGFDVVEVNDRDDGQTPTLAAKLLRSFAYAHTAANGE